MTRNMIFVLGILFGVLGCDNKTENAKPPQTTPNTNVEQPTSLSNSTTVDESTPSLSSPIDYHSYANTNEVVATHLDLDLTVDFNKKQLIGFVDIHIKPVKQNLSEIILDTRDLSIKSVQMKDANSEWVDAAFKLGEATNEDFGQPLIIKSKLSQPTTVRVHYATSPQASGLQWLTPEQTGGKKHPFLFSQAQAIHARSFIPLQDSPQVRVTYTATVRTPPELLALMSAANERNTPKDGEYHFEMKQAIPSYLIAIAVGDLDYQPMGERTGVYAEPYILKAAANEFEDTEAMLLAVEKKFGTYRWDQYDLLILPPSFPFGGMENPRLSFITPTVIAGDKSLVALIAHELAHSWSGNLVTNATWGDLWLNEGFTTYLTYRIMEIIYGKARFDMEFVLGYQSLEETVKTVQPSDQKLAIDLKNRDPDDSFSDIPYEKGALFITELEHTVGQEAFDRFLVAYFDHFAFKSTSTADFLQFVEKKLVAPSQGKLTMNRIKQWIFEPGIPENHPKPQSSAFAEVDAIRSSWLKGELPASQFKTEHWTVHHWLYFLNNLPEKLTLEQLQDLDNQFQLTNSQNNEIAHSWLKMAIRNNYQVAFSRLENYLIEIGRRKLIKPLYQELVKTDAGKQFATAVYRRARPGYHPLAQGTMDGIVGKP